MSDIDNIFARLGNPRTAVCPDCGVEHRTYSRESGTCTECNYYRTHPEMAPGYWTWTRVNGDQWAVVCIWRENEDLPAPGLEIQVHRKDGSTSAKTITEVRHTQFDTLGNFTVICMVA